MKVRQRKTHLAVWLILTPVLIIVALYFEGALQQPPVVEAFPGLSQDEVFP